MGVEELEVVGIRPGIMWTSGDSSGFC